MIIHSAEDMKEVAKETLLRLRSRSENDSRAQILLLSGELGAGKTTFVQALARILGVTERVTSPTFVIQKEYLTTDADFQHLVHIDAYRLNSISDLELLGWGEYSLDPGTLIALEWPERVGDKGNLEGMLITFKHREGGREVIFEY